MDEKELEKWLEDQPQEVAVAIASRAALRVAVNLPWADWGEQDRRELLTFTSLRCLLIPSLGVKSASENIRLRNSVLSAARSADSAADSATLSADSATLSADSATLSALSTVDSAALFAVLSARSANLSPFSANSALSSVDSAARSADFEFWGEVEWDINFFEVEGDAEKLMNEKLFNIEGNDWSASDVQMLRAVKDGDSDYDWWVDWLFAMHDGRFRDWDLADQIATEIEDGDWEKGAEAVAGWIDEFRIEAFEKDGPIAEEIDFDDEDGVFRKIPVAISKDDGLYDAILMRVADSLDDAIEGNRFTENDYEVRVVRRALRKYADDPQRVEMDLMGAGQSIERRVQNGDLPDDAEVFLFSSGLLQAGLDIRAAVPAVAEARARRREQWVRERNDNPIEVYKFSETLSVEISSSELGDEFREDFGVLVAGEDDGLIPWEDLPRVCADANNRIASRFIKIRREVIEKSNAEGKVSQALGKIEGSVVFRGANILVVGGGAVKVLTDIILLIIGKG